MIHMTRDRKLSYILGLYPSPETRESERETAYDATFRALAFSYNVSAQIEYDPKEWLDLNSLPHICLELEGQFTTPLDEFEHPDRGVYLVGNSKYPCPSYHLDVPDVRRIHVPTPVTPHKGLEYSLYGFQVLTIALHDRYNKCKSTTTL